MSKLPRYLTLLAAAVVALGGLAVLFFFYRMGTGDAKTLADFAAAYASYDGAEADYAKAALTPGAASAQAANDLERRTDEALAALNAKASARISSLTKNDGDLMRQAVEIAALAGQEVDALKSYQQAAGGPSAERDKLAKALAGLTSQRQAAYARYRDLAGR